MRRRLFILALGAAIAGGVIPFSSSSAHEYTAWSSSSISYSGGAFSGAVNSARAACRGGRSVVLVKARRNRGDRVAGRTTTGSNGTWSIGKARPRGRYYVRIARRVSTPYGHRHDCRATASSTIRVR